MLDLSDFIDFCQDKNHYSQFGQDLLALYLATPKTDKYFVEFGASEGGEGSNTLLLEREYGWNGILCEPSKIQLELLMSLKRTSIIDTRCVYIETGSFIEFNDCTTPGLGTINAYTDSDYMAPLRQEGTKYFCETITLDDLLNHYNAPQTIDYLSIDTEGSELDILSSYSFSRKINLLTVEHNYTESREKIYELLTAKNFVRVFEEVSSVDDWYVDKEFLEQWRP